jgi:hypothetical protein
MRSFAAPILLSDYCCTAKWCHDRAVNSVSVGHPGADAAKTYAKGARMAVEAERLCSKILAAGMAVFFTMAMPNRVPAQAAPLIRIADDASLCVDSMETEPFDDDQDAMPISATIDGGCAVPDYTIST